MKTNEKILELQIDSINDYVYQVLKQRKLIYIYSTYWVGTVSLLNELAGDFLVDYLTIQNNSRIPKKEELFKNFEKFYSKISKLKSPELLFKHIFRYASYYKRIVNNDIKDDDIKSRLIKINGYSAKDTYPYLMEVFEDYEFAHINKRMLIEILDTIIAFVIQRESINQDSKTLNFAELSTDINKMLALKDYAPRIVTKSVSDVQYLDNLNHKMTINDIINQNQKSTN